MAPAADDPADPDMLFDDVGLGYTLRDGRLAVCYPVHGRGGDGVTSYGSPFPIGPVPPAYWAAPPNAITAHRVTLWATLLRSRPRTTTEGATK